MADKKNPTEPKDTGSLPRERTTSECSITSDDGAAGFTGKRQKTLSKQFVVSSTSGLTAASPPKFVTLEEIMQAANGMRDMALVHQIVVDKDFKLKKAEPDPNSVQKAIKDTMHKAFWDVLKKELDENPPNYTLFTYGVDTVLIIPIHIDKKAVNLIEKISNAINKATTEH